MLSALLVPAVDWLDRRRVPRGGAVALVVLGSGALFGDPDLRRESVRLGLPDLATQVERSIDSATRWLTEGPLHLSRESFDQAGDTVIKAIRDNQSGSPRGRCPRLPP